ncbi:MAG: response regulator transcription factor [Mariniphaga sp.]
MSKGRILYVEDDLTLSFVTRDNLEMRGYSVNSCEDGITALERITSQPYDICVLDVMLPKMDGFMLARKIREFNQAIPIIFLTARSTSEDKIYGLQQGGDDYITKPFSIEELVLKIEIFLKRSKIELRQEVVNESFAIGLFTFTPINLRLSNDGSNQDLTHRESLLLEYLIKHRNKVVKREEILKSVWGNDHFFSSRSMDVFISRLRKMLKSDPTVKIESIHNVGYRLLIDESK